MNFKQWESTVLPTECIAVNRDTEQCVYITPNNCQIVERTHIPYNFFQRISVDYSVFLLVANNEQNNKLAGKFNGKLKQEFYSEEGTMFFNFVTLEDSFNFCMQSKELIINDFINNL